MLASLVITAALLATCWGCGSGAATAAPKTAPTPDRQTKAAQPAPRRMAAQSEVGALDEAGAQRSFEAALDGLGACVQAGARRLPVVGGSIELSVKVGPDGKAHRVWATQSSLGDRSTEKCMFNALRSVDWPPPIGGQFGLARNRFEFQRARRVREPGVWDAGRVRSVLELESVQTAVRQCRPDDPRGKLLVTLYIGEGGTPLAGGAAADESFSEQEVDCMVEALLAAEYPPPEQSPTRVRFRL